MYSLLKSTPVMQLLLYEAPTLVASFLIAELFYKFHSFTLETLCFLTTWGVLSGLAHLFTASGAFRKPHTVQ